MQTVLLILGVLLVFAIMIVGAYLYVPFVELGKPRREDMRIILVILGLVVLLLIGAAISYTMRAAP